MGSTKIINVLKNDSFTDIFDAFKKTQAEEVIFILPKNSRLAKNEEYFANLASEAGLSQKKISIMTADQTVQEYGVKHGFKLLSSRDEEDQSVEDIENKTPEETMEESDEEEINKEKEDEQEDESFAEPEPEEEDGLADLTMARPGSSNMSDIRFPEKPNRITVKRGKEDSSRVEIRKEPMSEKKLDKLESIWLDRDEPKWKSQKNKNFWDNFNFIKNRKPSASPALRNFSKIKLVFIGSAVLTLLIILYFSLGSAQILIQPQKQKLDFDLAVTVSSNYAKTETALNKIPGQYLAYSSEESGDFASTGKKDVVKKARGEITVFNNFNSEPQGLVATTRFESSENLIFRIPRSILIPGARLIDGQLVPGSIAVEVIADKPGAEYNINADKFTIPGFKGSPKYEGFYAQSAKPMSEGFVGLAKVVTENDFNTAKDLVSNRALAKAADNLKTKTGNLKILEPLTSKVVSLKATAEIDDAVDGFAVVAAAEAKAIGFLDDNLFKLVEAFINKNGDLAVLKNSINISYKNIETNFDKKTMSFTAKIMGEAASKIDQDKLVDNLLGMKQKRIKDYLLGIKEIQSAKVILAPFWKKSLPRDKKDIEIKMVY